MPPVRTSKITSYFSSSGPYVHPAERTPPELRARKNELIKFAPVHILKDPELKADFFRFNLREPSPPKSTPPKPNPPQSTPSEPNPPKSTPLESKRPRKRPTRPAGRGEKDADFVSSQHDWDDKYYKVIGTSTRNIFFGSGFKLTDDHIDDILALGRKVCMKLAKFIFDFSDVDYGAHNDAYSLTSGAIIRLAKACPNLKQVQLQATRGIVDDCLLALVENCPKLTCVEITRGSRSSGKNPFCGAALEEIRDRPDLVPKLKNLILPKVEDYKGRAFMKAMRSLGKARQGLVITLLERSEYKSDGDWCLETMRDHYWNGRKVSDW